MPEDKLPPEQQVDNQDQEANNQVAEEQKDNGSTAKKVFTTILIVLLLLAIILLILIGVKKCANDIPEGGNNNDVSSQEPIDIERNKKITDVFKIIINNKITVDGFDADELKDVIAVSYDDSNLSKIKLDITITSESKVYYYSLDNYDLPTEENTYKDIVSYLLLDGTNLFLPEGDATLNPLPIDKLTSITTDKVCKYSISKNSSDDRHLSGFYKDETKNEFRVYQKVLITEGVDPFDGAPNQIINIDSPLYNYYHGL